MTRYAIGLGSNVGDRWRHLVDAIAELDRRLGGVKVSGLYESEPVGGPDQAPYLNAVAVVDADLEPHDLLDVLQEVERAHGRERSVKWGPRTLDLDIVASDGSPIASPRLTVPHPRADEREFVLRPLSDVWPDALVADRLEAAAALGAVAGQGVDLLARRWIPPVPRWPAYALLGVQLTLILVVAIAFAYDGSLPEGDVTVVPVAGAGIAFIGMVLAFVASRRLGGAMTASPLPTEECELVMSGPYRYARHPIYGGVSMFMIGTALVLDSVIGFFLAVLLIPFFLLKAGYEERHLRMRFADYLGYKQTVTRRLIPFVM